MRSHDSDELCIIINIPAILITTSDACLHNGSCTEWPVIRHVWHLFSLCAVAHSWNFCWWFSSSSCWAETTHLCIFWENMCAKSKKWVLEFFKIAWINWFFLRNWNKVYILLYVIEVKSVSWLKLLMSHFRHFIIASLLRQKKQQFFVHLDLCNMKETKYIHKKLNYTLHKLLHLRFTECTGN